MGRDPGLATIAMVTPHPDVTPVILDTDLAMGAPGSDIDDGFALALAVADPALDLRLVTTVNGNTDVDSATILTADLLDRLGATEIPLHRGATRPLLRPAERPGGVPEGPRAASLDPVTPSRR